MKPKLLLLAAACLLPPIAATLLFAYGPAPEATTNRGQFIDPPVALAADWLGDRQERVRNSIWHLAVLAPAGCAKASCRQRLCMIHQARLVHVGRLPRIRLLWLAFGAGEPPARLHSDPACGRRQLAAGRVEGLAPIDVLAATRVVGLGATGRASLKKEGIFIIDPQGNAMMRYADDAEVADIARDLGRLLRLSRRG